MNDGRSVYFCFAFVVVVWLVGWLVCFVVGGVFVSVCFCLFVCQLFSSPRVELIFGSSCGWLFGLLGFCLFLLFVLFV